MTRIVTIAALVLAGCSAADTTDTAEADSSVPAPAEPEAAVEFAGTPGDYEVPGEPCLFNPAAEPELSESEQRRRDEIQSDTAELEERLHARYGKRLAEARLDMSGEAPRYRVRLTGRRPIPKPQLGGRAAEVPVMVEYGAPYSLAQVEHFREAGRTTAAQLLPQLIGVSYRADYGTGSLLLDVYHPGGVPDETALSHCRALRIAYGIPVLIRFRPERFEEQPLFG